MIKKIIAFIFLLSMIYSISGIENNLVYAEEIVFDNIDYTKLQYIRVISDCGQVEFDVSPQIIDGRTMVPMRAIFEEVGLEVAWNREEQIAVGTNEDTEILFRIGSDTAIVNDKEIEVDVQATIIDGRIMIPLRFLSENMGYNVVWIGDSNLILLSKGDIVEWRNIVTDAVSKDKDYFVKYINGVSTSDIPDETTVPSRSSIKTVLLRIYLSPSKQPYNSYIVGDTNEQAEMEDLASRIAVMLNNEYECEAILATLSLSRHVDGRPLEAKNKECDVYIGLHSNATGTGEGVSSGAIGFYHPESPIGKILATNIVDELNIIDPVKSNRPLQLVNGMSMFDGEGLAEVKHPSNYGMIAVLMETEFHDNPVTAEWILTHKYAIARAYVNGIVNTFNINKK